ncbi:hypothetical protein FOZ63_026320 [Perkinsus olseni]|uniref:Uncharacterized protein n=1 Tax=Perkinsus olseni TaxID=32597 RepID=A0A7J6PSA0_PEROL|nr:hypothetical protein FOZ63_026320 [Perkinsus olseni]
MTSASTSRIEESLPFTDTRSRVLGVEDRTLGTFNAGGRRSSSTFKGRNPQGEYDSSEQALPEHHECFPYTVKGQHILHSSCQETRGPAEDHRKAGVLPRNINGDCTIKDDLNMWYYGHNRNFYGGHVGSFNTKLYHPEDMRQ